ncbi:unnamed protein product [Lactuca saligna]|uniref:Uncharacterized protein n=1 Tax=Lactuca saligna TaxID=75948 RepID=A0AA35Y7P9_LACSI|nr:unnamed protein product [Lactuca saligna]
MPDILINPRPISMTTISQKPPINHVESSSNYTNRISKELKYTGSPGTSLDNFKLLEVKLDLILQSLPKFSPSELKLITFDELEATPQKVLSTSSFTEEAL